MSARAPVRVGNLLLWLVFIVALLAFVLTLLGIAVNIPLWAVWLIIAILAGAMLFP